MTVAMGQHDSTNWFWDIVNNFDNFTTTPEEMQNIHDLGIEPPGGCDCTYTDDADEEDAGEEDTGEEDTAEDEPTIETVGDQCDKYLKFITQKMQKSSDDSYATYTPYIESVQDHWFRDVYFVENVPKSDNENVITPNGFIDYDYQYEVITGERWTLYETYNNLEGDELYNPDKYGQFVYYILNEDGTTGERYEGDDVITGEVEKDDGSGELIRVAAQTSDGRLLVKKAKTIEGQELEDLGWNKLSNGSYSAYDPNVADPVPTYQKMYSNEEIEEEAETDLEKAAMEKLYIQIAITQITQTGEGLRAETNPRIKNMFLRNKYFKYDGSQMRAEIIYALRKKLASDNGGGITEPASGEDTDMYGAIKEDYLDTVYKYDDLDFSSKEYVSESLKMKDATSGDVNAEKQNEELKNKEFKISDYAASVTFNQTSLDAFSMLENTHTLDADYIYRDFKELVVELGYFQKEELTESKPRLLQWVVPDIGSAGFPDRSIDKREGEYGTMVHSKADIDANVKNKLSTLLEEMAEEDGLDGVNEFSLEPGKGLEGRMGANSNITMKEVGAIDGDVKKVEQVTIKEFLESTREMCEYINTEGYDYCVYATCDGDGDQNCTHEAHGNDKCSVNGHTGPGCNLQTTFEQSQESVEKHNLCCATLVSWALQKVGVMPKNHVEHGANSLADWIQKNLNPEIIEVGQPLKPGDILCYNGHIDLVGEEVDGGFVKYNGGAYVQVGATEFGPNSCIQKISGWPSDSRIQFALRLNWGGREGGKYEGYKGNEAVVSPVTGILMEYGTYNAEEAQENRENIDLKYGGLLEGKEFKTQETTTTDPLTGETTTTTEILYPYDKVGYAVIKVLDAETYQRLEATVNNNWQNNSLLQINEKAGEQKREQQADGTVVETVKSNAHVSFREDPDVEKKPEERGWDAVDETVYGYKEFVESYEAFGIAGNYIYIDGFKCEEVGEVAETEEGEDSDEIPKIVTPGKELTIDSFKVTESELLNEGFEFKTETKYEADEISKMISESYYNKLKAEADVKLDAGIGITFNCNVMEPNGDGTSTTVNKEFILIKEGTVLGRTYTDEEIVTDREGEYGTYEEYLEAQNVSKENDEQDKTPVVKTAGSDNPDDKLAALQIETVPLMGNYIRMIMQDEDGDIIENIEDYMKLDEEKPEELGDIEQFMFWQANEPEGFEFIMDGTESYALSTTAGTGGVKARRDNPSDKYGHDYAIDGKQNNNDLNLCPGICLRPGQTGRDIYKEVVGTDNVDWGVYVTGENTLEIYTKELEVVRQSVIDKVPIAGSWDENDTRLFALMDVMYAGSGNFEIGTLYSKLKSGDANLTKEDFLSNCTSENAFYNQNPTGFTRRRVIDYYMYSEGVFGHGIYGYDSEEVTQRWNFTSETPFQDIMVDKKPAELVDL